MTIKGIFYVLAFVSDLERSKRFYRDTLGWKLDTDEHGVAGLYFGSGYIVLHEDNRPPAERLYNGGMHIEVSVDDIDAQHATLKAKGVAPSEIRNQPWGERQFDFTDPDGYRWMYGAAAEGHG